MKPTLVIMAAGMGSRYGGLKQIDPVDEQGHIIMDFSIFDAVRAGFEHVVFIIKKENEADFRTSIGNRMEKQLKVSYAFQELNSLPEGFEVPEGRVKPFGTGHAVLSAADQIPGPFVVINADDYYGPHAYQVLYDYLTTHEDDEKYRYAMVGYALKNTLTENGHVARGVCETDENGMLCSIHERTRIEKKGDGAAYTEDEGKTWTDLDPECMVSMNMWGFSHSLLEELKAGFPKFLEENLTVNPLKCEYFLPFAVDDLVQEGKASVALLPTQDRWFGVTYKEDKPMVEEAIRRLKKEGLYPEQLWRS
ncbi:MAG: sugar phosphate nucleotidyltransferase [Eubacteriales bacterium]|nr:sugar phosphate nucleotidyltransferase [Eubacteriales bacterium]